MNKAEAEYMISDLNMEIRLHKGCIKDYREENELFSKQIAEKDAKIKELSNSAQFRRVEQQQKRSDELENDIRNKWEVE